MKLLVAVSGLWKMKSSAPGAKKTGAGVQMK